MTESTRKNDISRRELLKGAAATGIVAVAASSAIPGATSALAASTTVRGYGVTTSQLKDWSIMEKSIGLQMEFTGTNADIGVFMRDVISNDLGETHDIFIFDGGTEDILGPQGYYAEVIEDHPELTLWARTSDNWKRTDLLQDDSGKQYGILTGSLPGGTAAIGMNCNNWTNNSNGTAMLGHLDGKGEPEHSSWTSAHESSGCSQKDLRDTGSDGLFYCFAID